ncbi:DUF998 domain-containing protein [Agromyces seonyuensis]|uniref:DUF998 domain-containing protein n=1 Tax=Agromyces seonyuensis TaxID=2662446 RepID=A0A6I4P5W8_9MICO|nr:DUF998 domain-containing protein [Agromyces seonyuensis]MWB98997.1 DUF998 domain-containing protein [Agromyces seonyuensis]
MSEGIAGSGRTVAAGSVRRILRRPGTDAESVESVALLLGAAALVVVGLVALPVFWGQDVPISGRGSVGQFVAISSGIVALPAFVLGRLVARRGGAVTGALAVLRWFDDAALALAHALIVLLGWTALSDVFARSFEGAEVFSIPAIILSGAAAAVSAYAVYLSAVRLTPVLLSLVLAVFLVIGIVTSMLTSTDPEWWKMNLSALGMTDDLSAFAFNLTLIVAGAIVTIVARAGTAELPADDGDAGHGRRSVRISLVLIGIFLACVGIFHVDTSFWIHNSVATGMVVVFAVLVFNLRRWVPGMPKVFLWFGYADVAITVLLAVFFAVGYYTLTAVELVAAVLIFAWIIVFLRNAGAVGAVEAADAAEESTAGSAQPTSAAP